MAEIYHYLGATIHFSNNLVSAYDILVAFSVPEPAKEFNKIRSSSSTSTDLSGSATSTTIFRNR